MIAFAMSTTAVRHGNQGEAIMAEGSDLYSLYASTPFDFGVGLVSPTHAIDPGLVFPSEYEDYLRFLCSLPNIDPEIVQTAIGGSCSTHSFDNPSDLNIPSVTISELAGARVVRRRVQNVSGKLESYLAGVVPPDGVMVEITPHWFTVSPKGFQVLEFKLNVTKVLDYYSFGEIVLTGSLNHVVRIPLAVWPVLINT